MADTMQFDLVAPERSLASYQATEIQIPGADGDLTAMPGHAPVITTLRPGVVKVSGPEGEQSFVVVGGFAEVSSESVTVLAEIAHPGTSVKKADLEHVVTAARDQAANAQGDGRDAAEKFLADLEHLLEDMV
jgi:F-type H+-transporting ATPase subunit epsilon